MKNKRDPWYQRAWEAVYFPIYGFFRHILWPKIRPSNFKHWFQRAKYGYSDRDCWDIDYHLSEIIPAMIKKMRDNLCGHPASFCQEMPPEEAQKQWDTILKTIQEAFQIENDILNDKILEITDKDRRERMERVIEKNLKLWKDARFITKYEVMVRKIGWKNFQEYFSNLWD